MKTKLSNVDIIIECRDYRVPFTSRNPLFEESLVGRNRAFIYTKRDLGSTNSASDHEVWFHEFELSFAYDANHRSERCPPSTVS